MRRKVGPFDTLVVGAGIGGLTAACHAARLGLRTGLIEAELPGGLVVNVGNLDGYPAANSTSGVELASALQLEATDLGVEFIVTKALGVQGTAPIKVVETESGDHRAKRLVLAMGARLAPFDVSGFGRLWGRGVSQCAYCDGGLYRGKTVVVVGGGDAALQEGLHLAEYAQQVVLVHRSNRLTARQYYVAKAADSPAFQFRWSTEVVEILGSDGVEGVRLLNENENTVLPCSAVFPFIGLRPCTDILAGAISRDSNGGLEVSAALETSLPGVFAIGALRAGFAGQLTNAVSDGSWVAQSVARSLS